MYKHYLFVMRAYLNSDNFWGGIPGGSHGLFLNLCLKITLVCEVLNQTLVSTV